MSGSVVQTYDNLHLSKSKSEASENRNSRAINCTGAASINSCAVNCTNEAGENLPLVSDYLAAAHSENTLKAYAADLAHYEAWGGGVPGTSESVADYLAHHAEELSVATLTRRLAAISKVHRIAGYPSPTNAEIVKATLRGIRRTHGTAQQQAKPLLREDLFIILDGLSDRMSDVRDRALLLTGFAGALRRSELVALNIDDLERIREGLVLTVRRSKTDQDGIGRRIGIPSGRTRHCPVVALDNWLERSSIVQGPIFRSVDRGHRVSSQRLSGGAVSCIIKKRISRLGLDAQNYSGHSLRAGFATSAAKLGVSSWRIRAQTGHASDAMLARYIREGELFVDNAAGALL